MAYRAGYFVVVVVVGVEPAARHDFGMPILVGKNQVYVYGVYGAYIVCKVCVVFVWCE